MQGANDPFLLDRWRNALQQFAPANEHGNLVAIALVFAELSGYYAIWKQNIEDWGMITESQVVNSWIEKAEQNKELEVKRISLLRLLKLRLGSVSAEIEQVIRSQPSILLLDDWFASAAQVGSMEEFEAVVRQ